MSKTKTSTNSIAYFEIQASEPQKLVDFYKAVFGWKFTKNEKVPIEYFRVETDGMNGGILKRPANVPTQEQGTNAFTCSILVDNFDEYSKKILEAGGQVAMPKFAVPGRCWQGYFIDPDNNVFGVFEVDEEAK